MCTGPIFLPVMSIGDSVSMLSCSRTVCVLGSFEVSEMIWVKSFLIRVSIGVKREVDILRARLNAIARVDGVVFYTLYLPSLLDLVVHHLWALSSRSSSEPLRDGLRNRASEVVGDSV